MPSVPPILHQIYCPLMLLLILFFHKIAFNSLSSKFRFRNNFTYVVMESCKLSIVFLFMQSMKHVRINLALLVSYFFFYIKLFRENTSNLYDPQSGNFLLRSRFVNKE